MAQCRAARAWLNLTQAELAKTMGRGEAAIRGFERGDTKDTVFAIALQHVLEERGIIFLMAYGGYGQNGIVGSDPYGTADQQMKDERRE